MASPSRRVWAGTSLEVPLEQGLLLLKRLKPQPDSVDYQTWRQRFMLDRFRWGFWIAILCTLNSIGLHFYNFTLHPDKFTTLGIPYRVSLALDVVSLLCVFVCLILYRSGLGRRYPELVFLALSLSNTLAEQIVATYNGIAYPNMGGWSLVFMAQATLLPVRWWIHLLSQLVVLAYFLGVNSVMGLTVQGQPVYALSGLWLWFFWFCFICDLAVYLYERLKRAEFESSRDLRVFLHAVSHDLRTPSMGTAMVLQKLLKQSQEQIVVKRSVLERLLEGNDRQLTLINSLLEAHVSETQGITLHREPLQLSTVVEFVLGDLEPVLSKNQIQVTNQVDPDLPLVYADAVQLWRVFSNLITNVLKHNPHGVSLILDAAILDQEDKRIARQPSDRNGKGLLGANTKAEWIRCTVQDNGVGLQPNQVRRSFELYARGSRARYMPGLGLGLYLCKQIITAHGGQIGVNSKPGEGATFWFTLPGASAQE